MDMHGRDTRIYGIVAEICGFARTVWRGRGLDQAWDLGVYATVYLHTARVPCGLRTAIVIPIHALKIPDAGRIHAIHGQGPRTGRHTRAYTIRKKERESRYLEQKAEVSRSLDLDRQD